MNEPVRKRRRPPVCIYEGHPNQPSPRPSGQGQQPRQSILNSRDIHPSRESTVRSHPSESPAIISTSASALGTHPNALDIEILKRKVQQLEAQLYKQTSGSIQSPLSSSGSRIGKTTSQIAGTFDLLTESRSLGQPQAITYSVWHKTRLFGQSHWVNAIPLLKNIVEIIEPHLGDESSKAPTYIQKCKSLARVIKSRRMPQWSSAPTSDLPQKDVTDELVDRYLRTSESIHRILHIPTFRMDYEALWVSDTEPDTAFLVQLKLVLAIGATTYDDHFSLRTSATRWVYEAHTWLSEPKCKARLGIQYLQSSILLLVAREMVDVGGERIWIDAGALLRTAMYMGLHRDPAHLPKRTTFATEMRRRLWNTILEVTLQTSLTSGGPPLISLDDFDTEPPGNFDDDQLVAVDPVQKGEDTFTEVSIAIALRKTFSHRLAIAKFLNDLSSRGIYEEMLRLDAGLRTSYKVLSQILQECSSRSGPSPSGFEIRVVDFIMHRYLSSLHFPFFGLALHETAYAFSRKVAVETSLKIWRAAYPSTSSPPTITTPSRDDAPSPDSDDLVRLVRCASGFHRTVAIQAVLFISVELRTQLQEEESLGPVPLRPDLLSTLDDAKRWCLESIQAGETNIKGYVLTSVIAAEIEGLMRGLARDELAQLMVKAAEDAGETCLPLFEEMAGQGQASQESTADRLYQTSSNPLPETIEDWDFMQMPDVLFNTGNAEPMSWLLNETNPHR
ncbi:hypothetical protein AJ80_08038 [Polytolypa hystricis UAMH7299]|uniref:Xylanolytic transcriptional activator regulatory domain-containing protein n=1 Tax=Polytolypa hystricis (strain UAMH7299) TaxID=1447883 RepID=A0A2B7XEU2_POLH7|nr:hypothetical protein AJ80_08038 [Polytolypa hystricis UAMH7299]